MSGRGLRQPPGLLVPLAPFMRHAARGDRFPLPQEKGLPGDSVEPPAPHLRGRLRPAGAPGGGQQEARPGVRGEGSPRFPGAAPVPAPGDEDQGPEGRRRRCRGTEALDQPRHNRRHVGPQPAWQAGIEDHRRGFVRHRLEAAEVDPGPGLARKGLPPELSGRRPAGEADGALRGRPEGEPEGGIARRRGRPLAAARQGPHQEGPGG